jgi:hypothetical protein
MFQLAVLPLEESQVVVLQSQDVMMLRLLAASLWEARQVVASQLLVNLMLASLVEARLGVARQAVANLVVASLAKARLSLGCTPPCRRLAVARLAVIKVQTRILIQKP